MPQTESRDAVPPKKPGAHQVVTSPDVAQRILDDEEYVPALPISPTDVNSQGWSCFTIYFSTISNIYTLFV